MYWSVLECTVGAHPADYIVHVRVLPTAVEVHLRFYPLMYLKPLNFTRKWYAQPRLNV